MRKSLFILFSAAALLLTLTACKETDGPSEAPGASPAPAVSEDPAQTLSPAPAQGAAGEYYDLFQTDPGLVTLIGLLENADGGFTDDQFCAYAITELAVEGNYEYETGVTKEDMNAITQKHFGRDVQDFENSMTTILDNGRVTATGWSFDGSVFLALDGKAEESGGVITARFKCYQLSDSVWLDQEIEQEKLDHIKDYLLAGDDEDFPEPLHLEIVFEERFNEASRSPYVFYHSIREAQPG